MSMLVQIANVGFDRRGQWTFESVLVFACKTKKKERKEVGNATTRLLVEMEVESEKKTRLKAVWKARNQGVPGDIVAHEI